MIRRPQPDAAAPPRELWESIERAERQRGARLRAWQTPAWALRAAAAIVVAVGLGALAWWGSGSFAVPPSDAVVEIASAPNSMNDARFVELTKEVLRADPRYQVAMQRVMDQVVRDTVGAETAAEFDPPRAPDDERPEERPAGSRSDRGRGPVS